MLIASENLPIMLRLIPVGFSVILIIIALPRLIHLLLKIGEIVISHRPQEVYQKIVEPDKDLWQSFILLKFD